jgi:hypothetical protein
MKFKFALFSIFCSSLLFSQVGKKVKSVNISGITVSSDSLQSVPFTYVLIKGKNKGVLSDFTGLFSIKAFTGDTLVFSNYGYKKSYFIIADTLSLLNYSLIQILDKEAILLDEIVIKNWPSYEQFKFAFLNVEIIDNDLDKAYKNLNPEIIEEQLVNLGLSDGGNQKYMLQQQTAKLYYNGQLPPNNLLNPIVWAKFINAWRDGTLKNK